MMTKEQFDQLYGEHEVFFTKREAKKRASRMSKHGRYNVERAADVEILPIPTFKYRTYPENLHSQYRWYIKESDYLNK